MKLGSLFDGSGTCPLAATLCGITPVWASEIEPFPIAVTSARFPRMKHLGSVTDINGANIEPVDIITFGSPCQDLSVAGKRKGINDGERSSLFFEAVRIIHEMRIATNGKYPRFALWENVPGAFSSNAGNDFLAVLEAFAAEAGYTEPIPKPAKGKWANAGQIVGDGFSLAWRILDAQFWGVPQRRKRIFLVVDFTGEHAGNVLFEREGLRGHFEAYEHAGQAITADAMDRACGSAGIGKDGCLTPWDCEGKRVYSADGISPTLAGCDGGGGRNPAGFVLTFKERAGCEGGGKGILIQDDLATTLSTHQDRAVVYDARGNGDGMTAATMTGDHESRITDYTNLCIALQGNGIDRADGAGCNGKGWNDEAAYTLNTIDRHGVVYSFDALSSNSMKSGNPYSGCNVVDVAKTIDTSDQSPAKNQGGIAIVEKRPTLRRQFIVRRLTPLECCRLQGFPDWWCDEIGIENPTDADIERWGEIFETHQKILGLSTKKKTRKQLLKFIQNPRNDGREYKMWGNGMALPCVLYVMEGLKEALASNYPPA